MVQPSLNRAPEPVYPDRFNLQFEHDTLFEKRVNLKTWSGAEIKGVRAYSAFTAFFLNLFGKVIKTDVYDQVHHETKTLYINKNSLVEKVGLAKTRIGNLNHEGILRSVRDEADKLKLRQSLNEDEKFVMDIDAEVFKLILDDISKGFITNAKQHYYTLASLYNNKRVNNYKVDTEEKINAVEFLREYLKSH